MKRQLISMVAATVVFVIPFTASAVHASPLTPSEMLPPMLSGIELTQKQETQLAQIRSQTRAQIESILTSDQQNQLQAALARGEAMRNAFASIDLSPEQKTQLRTTFESVRTQIANIITPEQRQQIRQNVRSLMQQQTQ
jgi:Spy/CpxP family protein refolding chaperone